LAVRITQHEHLFAATNFLAAQPGAVIGEPLSPVADAPGRDRECDLDSESGTETARR
jgi:hypothetical protein